MIAAQHNTRIRSGFTLVELSIVLVILGLLVGGVLAGQSLIRAAELRAVPTEYARWVAATQTFRDKYFALPGDMTNATAFWGIAASCPGDFTTPAISSATCDGNGDGLISGNGATWSEVWRAWQHLAAAGLVEGSYTGVQGAAGDATFGVAGSNIPPSRGQNGAGYVFSWIGNVIAGHPTFFEGSYGNALWWGKGNGMDEEFIIAEEAWNVDTKIDDGRPAFGSMRVYKNGPRPNCASTNDASAEYLLTNRTRFAACNLLFISNF